MAMRELFCRLFMVVPVDSFLRRPPNQRRPRDLGKGLRSQTVQYFPQCKGAFVTSKLAEGYITGVALDADDLIVATVRTPWQDDGKHPEGNAGGRSTQGLPANYSRLT